MFPTFDADYADRYCAKLIRQNPLCRAVEAAEQLTKHCIHTTLPEIVASAHCGKGGAEAQILKESEAYGDFNKEWEGPTLMHSRSW